ncbi:MAG TPA: hypothetical protein DCF61_02695 [Alphaproteobacteria bacterium]|nr:hypothetical protein [Alphaproteobacteria bacterium]
MTIQTTNRAALSRLRVREGMQHTKPGKPEVCCMEKIMTRSGISRLTGCAAFSILAMMSAVPAASADSGSAKIDSFEAALTGGKFTANFRYRYEMVEQSGLPEDARASTLRSRLGYHTGQFEGFSAMIEAEDIRDIGDDDYNSTTNGKVRFPVVADPDETEINQAFIDYTGLPGTKIVAGRQRIKLDNDRFIGNVGFRQNEQTFDALRIDNTSLTDISATYVFIDNVNRIFGSDSPIGDHEMTSHLFNISYSGWSPAKITGYAYLLDYDNLFALSTQTYGLRAAGKHKLNDEVTLHYTGEYAHQSDFDNNPAGFDHDYYLAELGVTAKGITAKAGYEVLSGDGTTALQTPLATGHKFNGWADKFLVTPVSGLADSYVSLSGQFMGVKLLGAYHMFDGDSGGADLGDEVNLLAKKTFRKRYTTELKGAFYEAGRPVFGLTDTDRIWFSFIVKI